MTIYLILLAHYIGDFVVQTNWMAMNKSKSLYALSLHIVTYSLCLCLFGWYFAFINGVAHFFIDLVTSRCSSATYRKGNTKLFWAIIGFDQMLHTFTLVYTWKYFLGGN